MTSLAAGKLINQTFETKGLIIPAYLVELLS